ncbi:MAG: enoyl-CoA hydratase/isomerase family protein [Desulfobacteraceae bacterium]|nr:enoyl-CoA hydratase/isomerase family protein [Desulfobacteraceae bacterium]
MTTIKTESMDNVTIIRLDNGVTNAINLLMVRELAAVLAELKKKYNGQNHGIVLCGNPKFFSIGFDLPSLINEDRNSMSQFFYAFNELALTLYTLPFPSIAALSGHAAAGGYILSLMCDFRFADSDKKLGLNELLLGIPAPYLTDMVMRQISNDRVATTMLFQGNFITASDALGSGLIDKVFTGQDVEKNAMEKAAALANSPGPAFAQIKSNRVEDIKIRYEKKHKEKNDAFLDCWFGEPAQTLLKEAVKKF